MPWLDELGYCAGCGEYSCECDDDDDDQEEFGRALMTCRCMARNNALIGPHEGAGCYERD